MSKASCIDNCQRGFILVAMYTLCVKRIFYGYKEACTYWHAADYQNYSNVATYRYMWFNAVLSCIYINYLAIAMLIY